MESKKIKSQGKQMNGVDQSMGGIYFQEEILMDIISRLPLRSLHRFKCLSKFWKTLISDPSFEMKTKLSPEEIGHCTENILYYLFHLVVGLYKDRKADLKEFMRTHPLDQPTLEFLGYVSGSDEHPSEDDNTDEDEEVDSEYESSDSEEYDIQEVVGYVEFGDGSADDNDDGDADDGEKGKLSAEEEVDPGDNRLFYTLYMVPLFEGMYKDRKADLKEIQEKYPLSRLSRELLGYDSGSKVCSSEDDNTKDERAVAEEHDSKKIDAAKSDNGSGR